MDIRRTEVAVAAFGHCRAEPRPVLRRHGDDFRIISRAMLIGARTDVFLLDAARAARAAG